MWTAIARPATLAILLTAVLAGCLAPGSNDVQATDMGSLTVAPGNKASLPIILEGTDWNANETSLRFEQASPIEVILPQRLQGGADGALTGWVTFAVPAGTADGTHTIPVIVAGERGTATARFTVHVESPAAPLEEGQTVLLNLTMRTAAGAIINTNDPVIIASPIPLAEGAEPAPEDPEPFPLQLVRHPQMPDEVLDALLAGAIGHSVQTEDEQPERIERTEPRSEEVPREQIEQRVHDLEREMAEMQGIIPPDAQEGDRLAVGGPLPYVIEHLSEDSVRIVLDVETGQTLTLYEAWPDATEVTEMGDEVVILRTTPGVAEGEAFTWRSEWPDATTIHEMDDDRIVLLHSPQVGMSYTSMGPQGAPSESRVDAVDDEAIHLSEANTHPLAGQVIYLELTIVDVQEAPDAGMDMGS